MENEIEIPYPEIQKKQEEDYIKSEYQALLAREAAQQQAEIDAKLTEVERTGNGFAEVLADRQLRIKFTEKFGWRKFGVLNRKHLDQQTATRQAEELRRKQSRQASTTWGRISAANKARKVGQ